MRRRGKSTLNRWEVAPARLDASHRYCKIGHDAERIEDLFVTWFLEGSEQEPEEVVLAWLVERLGAYWPHTRIGARGDSGFAREELLNVCEASEEVYHVLGRPRTYACFSEIGVERVHAQQRSQETGKAARVFTECLYGTRKSWSRSRRVIAKAEAIAKGPNPRFVVTNLPVATRTCSAKLARSCSTFLCGAERPASHPR